MDKSEKLRKIAENCNKLQENCEKIAKDCEIVENCGPQSPPPPGMSRQPKGSSSMESQKKHPVVGGQPCIETQLVPEGRLCGLQV